MIDLYDVYCDEIYYSNSLNCASIEQVRALYIAYSLETQSYARYQNLRYFSCNHCMLEWDDLSSFAQLEHFSCERPLSFPQFPITQLMSACGGLLELKLVDMPLARGDQLQGLERFKKLRHLKLVNIAGELRLEALLQLQDLECLEIEGVDLSTVAFDLSKNTKLKQLVLKNCQMHTLPIGLAELNDLEFVDFGNNPIQELPEWIGHFHHLQELNIENCGLTTLPSTLVDLKKSRKINAFLNPIEALPKALLALKSKLKIELKYRALYDDVARERYVEIANTPAEFKDFGFKLMVIQRLMYEDRVLQPAFDVHRFAESYSERAIDLHGEEASYVIPEVKAYFEQLVIPLHFLDGIQELVADGGDDIYGQLSPLWDGEADFYFVHSAIDAKQLGNLKRVESPFLTTNANRQFVKLGIEVDSS